MSKTSEALEDRGFMDKSSQHNSVPTNTRRQMRARKC